MSKETSTSKDLDVNKKTSTSSQGIDSAGRVVTDAVHERFVDTYVFCELCKLTIVGDHINIPKHFDKTHYSDSSCLYCKGKVFRYCQLSTDQDIAAKEFIFHRCRDWL